MKEEHNKCLICNKEFKSSKGVGQHISKTHKISKKEYYEKYYPKKCLYCNKKLNYTHTNYFRLRFCSKQCTSKYYKNKKGKTKYDTEYLLQILKEIHEKYEGKVTLQLVRLDGRVSHSLYYSYFNSFIDACKKANVPYQQQKQTKYKYEKPIETLLTVLVDNREKTPYKFKNKERTTLNIGDYRLKEVDNNILIERKSISDLKGTMSGGYNTKRFAREMERAREQKKYVVILIDCDIKKFMETPNYGKMTNKGIYHNIKRFGSIYSDVCQFLFTGSRIKSSHLVYKFCVLTPDVLLGVDLQELYDKEEFDKYYFG